MMTKDNISLHSISIDSLKFRIPLSLLKSVNPQIQDIHFEGNLTTGEIDETSFKKKAKEFYITESVKVKALIQKRATALNYNEDCLIIYLNSKILGSKYFEGLTANNIELVFNQLTKLGLLDCSFDTFLDSECTDIDLKLDDSMSLYEWKLLLEQFRKMSVNPERYKSFRPKKDNPLNIGLQFSQRTTRSYNKPFFKLYHKGGELKHNSTEFKNEYFSNIDDSVLTSLVRIETTIKDKKHAKLLGIEKTTLQSLLLLKDEQKFQVFRKIFEKHLRPMEVHTLRPRTNQPTEILLFNAIAYLIEVNKFSIDEVTKILLNGIECRKTRSRKKAEIMSIYEKHIQGSEIDVSVHKVKQFLQRFEWC